MLVGNTHLNSESLARATQAIFLIQIILRFTILALTLLDTVTILGSLLDRYDDLNLLEEGLSSETS